MSLSTLALTGAFLLPGVLPDIVVIELADGDAEARAAIAESCSEALVEPPCVVIEPGEESDPAAGPVVLRARVRMAQEGPPGAVVTFEDDVGQPRAIEFDPADPPGEQQRAIGLVIAARALELTREREPETPDEPPALPPDPTPPPPVDAPQPSRWLLDAAALLGPGLDAGPARLGLVVRGGYRPVLRLPLSLILSLRGAARLEAPTVLWTSVGLGLLAEVPLGDSPFALGARAELLGQRVGAQIEEPEPASEPALRAGAIFGADLTIDIGALRLLAGAELSLLDPLVLTVGETEVGREQSPQPSGFLGMRLGF